MEFSEKLKELRKAKGLTQAQLAKRAGFSNGAIGNYESGKRVKISLVDVCRLADALGVEPEELGLQRRFDLERKMRDAIARHKTENDRNMQEALINAFFTLNEAGRKVAVERLQELTMIDKYVR